MSLTSLSFVSDFESRSIIDVYQEEAHFFGYLTLSDFDSLNDEKWGDYFDQECKI